MGKKSALIVDVILILAILLCVGLASLNTSPENHVVVSTKTRSFDSLEQMEEFSDIIVRGVRLPGGEATIKNVNGAMVLGYTMSQFSVTEVFQDKTGTIQPGMVITVLENEVYDESAKTVYHVAKYSMMEENAEYLLFASQAELSDGTVYYVSSGVNYGTVSLQEDDRFVQVQRATMDFNSGEYEEIWEAAKRKYTD